MRIPSAQFAGFPPSLRSARLRLMN